MRKFNIENYNEFIKEKVETITKLLKEKNYEPIKIIDTSADEYGDSVTVYFSTKDKYADIEIYEDNEICAVTNKISRDDVLTWQVEPTTEGIENTINTILDFMKDDLPRSERIKTILKDIDKDIDFELTTRFVQ